MEKLLTDKEKEEMRKVGWSEAGIADVEEDIAKQYPTDADEIFAVVHVALMKRALAVDCYPAPAIEKLNQATKLSELTDWVKSQDWDVESWVEFILEVTLGLPSKVDVGSLARFST